MSTPAITALAALSVASSALAQSVSLRIVERTGQTTASVADPELDLAVQALCAGTNLSRFSFNIRIPGEAESRGVLARGAISNLDGTYDPAITTGATVGRAGLARQYSYLATINASLNGVINQSAATFTNTPDQEIGLVAASAQGTPMLGTPGIDADNDGNPDTWPGNGTGSTPASGATATVNPAAATSYFAGSTSGFVDVYRFRYTVTDFSAARNLHFQLDAVIAQTSSNWTYDNGLWGANITTPGGFASIPLNVQVAAVPAPATAAPLAFAGLLVLRRRRPSVW